jgi:hypothetical protein
MQLCIINLLPLTFCFHMYKMGPMYVVCPGPCIPLGKALSDIQFTCIVMPKMYTPGKLMLTEFARDTSNLNCLVWM